ncbi:MAG: Tex-like N-terminal domain-containing protein, partial [Bacteroidales bacterium]|nr:Tex-like N-terminal domain-containing protein [Bacteroidales bacterium]
MTQEDCIIRIALEMQLQAQQVKNTLLLLDEGATIPFISRYRKEMTGSLDEVQVMQIRDHVARLRDLNKRREAIIASLEEQGMLTETLRQKIAEAETMALLEDIYLPFRPKRRTRAQMAREKGLEPLAKILMSQPAQGLYDSAKRFVNPSAGVENTEEAIAGAKDIVSEWISEHLYARKRIRSLFEREASIVAAVAKDKEVEGEKYQSYFTHQEKIIQAPSHRLLAMFRGENEGFLKITIRPPEEKALEILNGIFIKNSSDAAALIADCVKDSYKRLLAPSIETEIRQQARKRAEEKAIQVFAENLRQLLMA